MLKTFRRCLTQPKRRPRHGQHLKLIKFFAAAFLSLFYGTSMTCPGRSDLYGCCLASAAMDGSADAFQAANLPHLVLGSEEAENLEKKGIIHFNPSSTPGVNSSHFFKHPLIPYVGGIRGRENNSCRAEAMQNMLDWLGRGGAYFPKVGLQPDPSTGGGGVALEEISRNELFMKIPSSLMIHPSMASTANPLLRILQKHWSVFSLEQAYNKDKVILAFFLVSEMLHLRNNKCSKFQPYFDHLPISYRGFPINWNSEDISYLQNSSFIEEIDSENARFRDDFRRACKLWNLYKSEARNNPSASMEDRKFNFDCDDDSMILPHHSEPSCWHIRKSDRPQCKGYEEAGYTCVGDNCAAIDPEGDPHLCARLAPRGFVLSSISGRCVKPGQISSSTHLSKSGYDDDEIEWNRWLQDRASSKIHGINVGTESWSRAQARKNPSEEEDEILESILSSPPKFELRTCPSEESRPVGDRTYWSVWHWYKWARLVVSSRSWRIYPYGRVSDKDQKSKSEYSSLALVPLADNLNHVLEPGTVWTFDSKLDSFTIKATRKIKGLSPILDSYGQKKNTRFLLSFGFVSDEAPNEIKLLFPPKEADVSRLLYKELKHKEGSTQGGQSRSYPLSIHAVPVVRNLMTQLIEIRNIEWKHKNKEFALTGDVDSSGATLFTSLIASKELMDERLGSSSGNPNQQEVESNYVWASRVITAVSSMKLSLYPTSLAEDKEILKEDEKLSNGPLNSNLKPLTWWQRNAIKLRMGEKQVLRAWARFGVVLAHNHMLRPRQITLALTLAFDGSISPAFRVHNNIIPLLFKKANKLTSADRNEGEDSHVLSSLIVGTPVFAQWANNGQYYDGVIVARSTQRSKKKSSKAKQMMTSQTDAYVVQFFDGDFQAKTPIGGIRAFPQNFLDSMEYQRAVMQTAQEVVSGLDGICVTSTKDYWTYDVCVSGVISQYHKNPDGSKSSITILGRFIDTMAVTLRCRSGVCLREATVTEKESISKGGTGTSGTVFVDHENSNEHPHVYTQEFHNGDDGRTAEVLYVCRREKKASIRQMAARGESHALGDITGTGLIGNSIFRDSQNRTRKWERHHNAQILSIEEPKIKHYQIVVGTEAACVGLIENSAHIVDDIIKTNEQMEANWEKNGIMGNVPWGLSVNPGLNRDKNGPRNGLNHQLSGSFVRENRQNGERNFRQKGRIRTDTEKSFHKSPLSFRNLDSVMCVISRSQSARTFAMASITASHSDGTFDVTFDSRFSTRTKVPLEDLLPVPKQLLSLPCWLFNDVPGAGC